MNEQELIRIWKDFTKNNDFVLNPDSDHVQKIASGCLENEKRFGLKLCPCRIRDGTKTTDLQLLCPCNFKTHQTWLKPEMRGRPECWCGLFIKRQ